MTQPLTDRRSRGELIAELYDRHAAGLFVYCLDQLGDADAAADALAAVLAAVPAVEPPRAALYTLARREIFRRDVVQAPPRVDASTDPVGALIERVLREMRPHQREVLLLAMVCGLSVEELARVLDVATDTALDMTLSADNRFTQAFRLALKSAGRISDAGTLRSLAEAPAKDVLARLPWRPPPARLRLQVHASASPATAKAAARLALPVKPLWPAAPPEPASPTASGPASPAGSPLPPAGPASRRRPHRGGAAGAPSPEGSPAGRETPQHERTTEPLRRARRGGFVALPSWPSLLPTPAAARMGAPGRKNAGKKDEKPADAPLTASSSAAPNSPRPSDADPGAASRPAARDGTAALGRGDGAGRERDGSSPRGLFAPGPRRARRGRPPALAASPAPVRNVPPAATASPASGPGRPMTPAASRASLPNAPVRAPAASGSADGGAAALPLSDPPTGPIPVVPPPAIAPAADRLRDKWPADTRPAKPRPTRPHSPAGDEKGSPAGDEKADESTDVLAVIDLSPEAVRPAKPSRPSAAGDDRPDAESTWEEDAGRSRLGRLLRRSSGDRERHFDWLWELGGFLVALAIAMLVFFAVPMIVTP